MALTPEDVQSKRFTVTRFRPGYDEEEVDAFLDEVEAELRRLLAENASAGQGPVRDTAPPPPAAPAPEEAQPAAAVPTEQAAPRAEEGQEAALRTLLLAQKTADEAVAQARVEAEQIVSEARQRAADLERQAHEQHVARLSSLSSEREQLEAQVESLRDFEREHRERLRAYLEAQLREVSSAPPLVPAGGPAVPQVAGSPGAPSRPESPAGPHSGPQPGSAPPVPQVAGEGPGPVAARGAGRPTPPPFAPAGRPPTPQLEEDTTPGADLADGPPREARSELSEGEESGTDTRER